ncbi:hypothetical protein PIB30_084492 [Stylosanthes scabra]|uniref:Uncharacterized protein n=1 Tax=Stylosanthes scabra TaxID=79078 RepID=A0ABU6YQ69_9FABA|nr:hypothetical protein [Stylosanthes scabra]
MNDSREMLKTAELTPRHKKLAPGLPTPRRGCLALGHQFWCLDVTLGAFITQFWSATPVRWFWHLGVKTGRLASADGRLDAKASDPKTHGTKFDMKHALLIYVLMTEGAVNLPRIMRDILLVCPTKHPRHLLPFPVFIMRLANPMRCRSSPMTNFRLFGQ